MDRFSTIAFRGLPYVLVPLIPSRISISRYSRIGIEFDLWFDPDIQELIKQQKVSRGLQYLPTATLAASTFFVLRDDVVGILDWETAS